MTTMAEVLAYEMVITEDYDLLDNIDDDNDLVKVICALFRAVGYSYMRPYTLNTIRRLIACADDAELYEEGPVLGSWVLKGFWFYDYLIIEEIPTDTIVKYRISEYESIEDMPDYILEKIIERDLII